MIGSIIPEESYLMHTRIIFRNVLLFVVMTALNSAANNEHPLYIAASGETHAMLMPCDCPVNPGGGLAKRAHIVKSWRDTAALLLLDAGGFAGGGMYDSYTEGRFGDSVRTLLTIQAMAAMGYDAVAIGDDDLQYGAKWLAEAAKKAGLPLVSANCVYANGGFVGAPYVLVKKGKWTFAITGLTTQEKFAPIGDSVRCLPPFPALRKLWTEMGRKADYRIVLSHVGEEQSRMVQDSFPGCNVIVNGHRKNMIEAVAVENGKIFMQFGFAGKNISWALVKPVAKAMTVIASGWAPVTPEVPDDSAVLGVIRSRATAGTSAPAPNKAVLDLYIMSHCPYGLKALKEFIDVLMALPTVEWHVWFIGSQEPDSSLSSLHGVKEIDDEKIWLAVQSLYPGLWLQFLNDRASSHPAIIDSAIKKLGMDLTRIQAWVNKNGTRELLVHYNRSVRLDIHASPTLLMNNASVDIEITKLRLAKAVCGQMSPREVYCDSVPECVDNADCGKKGMVGTCMGDKKKARCVYKDAVHFTFTVLMPDSLISHPEREVIATTSGLFEGAVIETISVASAAGKNLLSQFAPKALPFYVFDKKVSEADNYEKVETGLEPKNGRLVFKEGYVKKAYFLKRQAAPGCEIYIDPLFSGVKEALAIALKKRLGPAIKILPLLTVTPDLDSLSNEERLNREEAQRWLLLAQKYPEASYRGYLEAFLKRKDSSYWFLTLKDLRINVDAFVKDIGVDNGRLRSLWKTQTEMGIGGPVELVIGNREVVRIKSRKDLEELLEKMK